MTNNRKIDKDPNILNLDGLTFKTSGNIVFADAEENPFRLAQSDLLDKMDGYLDSGMQLLLRKVKT